MPPLPVIRDRMGFLMFAHPDGRFSAAMQANGVQVYARDYSGHVGEAVAHDDFLEPDDSEFVKAMKWHGRKAKGNEDDF